MTSDRNLLAEQLLELAPAIDVAVESGQTIATSAEPWLRFKSLAPFQASRFIEITYRSSLYDDPVRPILRFITDAGAVERFLPGPVAGAGIWRGAVPRKLKRRADLPRRKSGAFRFPRRERQASRIFRNRRSRLGEKASKALRHFAGRYVRLYRRGRERRGLGYRRRAAPPLSSLESEARTTSRLVRRRQAAQRLERWADLPDLYRRPSGSRRIAGANHRLPAGAVL